MSVTKRQLDWSIERLNKATGNPVEPYTKGEDGRNHANIGNYHLSQQYGGVQLVQMSTNGGGIHTVQPYRGTKRECWQCVESMLKMVEK